jgi:protoheme IX farnesyltransferase
MTTYVKNSLSLEDQIRAYIELTKPRIVTLLVFTCVTSMIVAADGIPALDIILFTIIGGMFSAGGSSAINQYIDREMDAKMNRTARRPIPSGRITPMNALVFGLGLVAWSVLVLGVFVNWLAAGLALIGAIYYVVVYTLILKRNTVVNIIIGGGAGAIPVLVGWAAATGTLDVQSFILFAIVFYWTPPHSWALAIMVNKDYAAANVPMMPVARGERVTRYQILFYSVQLFIITLIPGLMLLIPSAPVMLGWIYLLLAAVLGIVLIYLSIKLIQIADKATARVLYKYSSAYLAFLFLAMMFDRLLL